MMVPSVSRDRYPDMSRARLCLVARVPYPLSRARYCSNVCLTRLDLRNHEEGVGDYKLSILKRTSLSAPFELGVTTNEYMAFLVAICWLTLICSHLGGLVAVGTVTCWKERRGEEERISPPGKRQFHPGCVDGSVVAWDEIYDVPAKGSCCC